MNIFLQELKANRKALIIWSVCMFLLVVSGMGKYTAYSSGGGSAVFNDMPRSVKAALGIGSFDVTTMSGFFAMLFLYLELAVSIHAALLGSGIISKEERDKTTEFLITRPVTRTTIVTSKLLAAFVNIVILNLVVSASSVMMVSAYNKGKDITGEISMFLLSMFFVQILFLAVGAAMAACIRNSKASGSLSAGVLLLGYLISRLTDFSDRFDILNLLSPFKYFDYTKIVAGEGLNGIVIVLVILLSAFLCGSTYYCYNRRDLNV